MKKLIYLIPFLLLGSLLHAQIADFEVVVTKKTAQLPSYPMAYVDNPLKYFSVTITNNTGMPADVYLSCAMKFNGHRIVYSDTTPTPQPLVLSPGLNVMSDQILDAHFSRDRMNLDAEGMAAALPTSADLYTQLSAATRLPEGDYQLSLFVHRWVDAATPTPPETEGSMDEDFEILYSGTPPELITPLSEQVNWGANQRIDSRDRTRKTHKTTKREDDFSLLTGMGRNSTRNVLTPQRKLTFRWSPVITTSTRNPQFEYTLKIVAVMPQQNAQDAIEHNPVVVTMTTKNTYCIIDTLVDMKYQFEQGSSYAVQVQAKYIRQNTDGIAGAFEDIEVSNEGKSQVVSFSWGKAKYSIAYDELRAPLDTAILEVRYQDNIQQLLRKTKLPQILSPADIVSPDTFDISFSRMGWTPVTGPDITDVKYTARIFEYKGETECTLNQQPVSRKNQMIEGRYYYLDVETAIIYHYLWDTTYAVVHYVNGIEADTESETVHGEADGAVVRHVGKVFLYGTQKAEEHDRKYETPSVGLRLAANYDKDSSCIHLNWYHHYKSKAGDKKSRDKKKSKGMFHAVVYRSIDGGPFVGIAALPSDQESYIDRDVQPGQTVRYFIKLHLTQYKQSKPSNTTRTVVPGSSVKAKN